MLIFLKINILCLNKIFLLIFNLIIILFFNINILTFILLNLFRKHLNLFFRLSYLPFKLAFFNNIFIQLTAKIIRFIIHFCCSRMCVNLLIRLEIIICYSKCPCLVGRSILIESRKVV